MVDLAAYFLKLGTRCWSAVMFFLLITFIHKARDPDIHSAER
jgi:hypothetical protein